MIFAGGTSHGLLSAPAAKLCSLQSATASARSIFDPFNGALYECKQQEWQAISLFHFGMW